MILLINELQNKQEIFSLFFTGYYASDTWDMTKHPYYKDMKEHLQYYLIRRVHNMHFERCNNVFIKDELKYHLYHFLEIRKQKLTCMPMRIASLHTFIEYINEHLMGYDSILKIPYAELIENYRAYLQSKGYKLLYLKQKRVTKDMEKKEYCYSTKYEHEVSIFYNCIEEFYHGDKDNKIKEVDKNRWDIRKLPFKIDIPKSRPRYTISFENIQQEKIRDLAKRFTLLRLKNQKYSTCIDDLKGINLFSKFLDEYYPDIKTLKQLNRAIVEDFIGYVRLCPELKERTQVSRIGSVNTFFCICQLNNWENSPVRTLILPTDYSHSVKTFPQFFDDEELRKINSHLLELPVQIARMTFVIENVGMRISELCTLKVDCIKPSETNEYSLTYYQEKTMCYNTVPITNEVAGTIYEAIETSKEKFGDKIKYVFSQNEKKPINQEMLSYYLNRLILDNKITGRDGKLLRVKSHVFRGTVASKYANIGLNQDIIRMLLGQKTIGSLKHYVAIHNETVIDAMKDIIDMQDDMIKNIGKIKASRSQNTQECNIPLPNGECAKPTSEGKCDHANACYTCRMFKASSDYLEVYKHQYNESLKNIEIAKVNGWERILQINEDLRDSLVKIIDSCKKDGK